MNRSYHSVLRLWNVTLSGALILFGFWRAGPSPEKGWEFSQPSWQHVGFLVRQPGYEYFVLSGTPSWPEFLLFRRIG